MPCKCKNNILTGGLLYMFNNSIDNRLHILLRANKYHLEGLTRQQLGLVPYSNDHKTNKNNEMITIENNKISFLEKLKIMFLTPWFDLDLSDKGCNRQTQADCEEVIWKRVDANLKKVIEQAKKNSTD